MARRCCRRISKWPWSLFTVNYFDPCPARDNDKQLREIARNIHKWTRSFLHELCCRMDLEDCTNDTIECKMQI
ncbi:hypothetical protein GQ600_10232 [Phytophthora cactorum]|nr:hypothetical protein GQ600_10232 [Phytophthora cactorum]